MSKVKPLQKGLQNCYPSGVIRNHQVKAWSTLTELDAKANSDVVAGIMYFFHLPVLKYISYPGGSHSFKAAHFSKNHNLPYIPLVRVAC